MNSNWLFQIPDSGSFDEQRAIIQARFDADPGARAIADEEAEAFMASAMGLVFTSPDSFATFARAFGLPGQSRNKAFRRQATLLILRSWRHTRMQEFLKILRSNVKFDDLAAADEGQESLPLEVLEEAYYKGQNVIWLCHLLRHTDRADQIPTFLDSLDEFARSIYPIHLDVGRLMIRRIVDGVNIQAAAQSRESAQHLKAQLKQKTRGEAQMKREMTDQRRVLARQERLRQSKEAGLVIYLEGVRQEVAATEGRLAETIARQSEEEAALRERRQAHLADLAVEAASVEADFARALGARTTAWPLADLRVALTGEWGDAERLLIESAGGRLVPQPVDRPDLLLQLGQPGTDQPAAGIFFTSEKGPAALERLLYRRILPQISRYRPS